ncbi:MAG TPA: transglutaminase domain-containing protein [Syntrophales bacterium]|nr:transglutaminase domain-containing protein [Syntrophales bacterium]
MKRIFTALLSMILIWPALATAENYTVKGDMGANIRYELQEQVTAGGGIQKMTLSFVVPQNFQSPTTSQEIKKFGLVFSPEPQEKKNTSDGRGNQIVVATWIRPPDVIDVRLVCDAQSETKLPSLATQDPFPIGAVKPDLADYLKPTEQVQSNDPRVRELAAKLTGGVTTEFDAVQRIIAWVVDHVRYVTPPPRYDAVYSLESGKGNCQNFSHLSAALLRSVGIPVRIVNGVTFNQPFDIAWQKGTLTFKMGQGRHSWVEVWFPQLGWVPFDPQNTMLFVSTRYLRIEVGVDNNETKNDGLLKWAQMKQAERPKLQESIAANFNSDKVNVKGAREAYGPKNLLLSPLVKAEFKQIEVTPPPPPPVISEEEKKGLRYEVPFVYGNLEFPENVDFAFPRVTKASGVNQFEMSRNFLVETAEYVTTNLTQYAQVVVLRKPVKLQKVGLALHKFGGDGLLWVDLFQDDQGKPGQPIATSDFVNLDQLSLKPGYRWTDFDFGRDNPILMPGSYWIALGFTGSPIVNWFYTYGKPVGPVDGTRYKSVFQQNWSGALNYEFNYRVSGLTAK